MHRGGVGVSVRTRAAHEGFETNADAYRQHTDSMKTGRQHATDLGAYRFRAAAQIGLGAREVVVGAEAVQSELAEYGMVWTCVGVWVGC